MRFTNPPPYFPPAQRSPATPILPVLAAAIPAAITGLLAFRSTRNAAVLPPTGTAAPGSTIPSGSGVDAAKAHLDAAVRSLAVTGIGDTEARLIVQSWTAPK
jgi:hypothetical protein